MRNTKTVAAYTLGLAGLAGLLALAFSLNSQAPSQGANGIVGINSLTTIDIDNGDLKIDWSTYGKYDLNLSENNTIVKAGVYHVTGNLEDAPIVINAGNDKIRLILDNVTVKNSKGPAIACYAADDLVIELVGENVLRDGNKYDESYDDDVKGAIYSKADLTFEGSGALILTANYQDGIVSKDDLKFNSGNYTIIAADDAIRGKDSVYIVNGDFNINSYSDGIKSTNDTIAGKGFVLIENGHIKIAAGDDAIYAENNLYIYNGNIDITKSYEGLEGHAVTINGGNIKIVSSDDGINAAGDSSTSSKSMMDVDENSIIAINGGDIYVNASGDGIDSNGYIYINNGVIVVDGPTNNGNGALDASAGITMKGGTLLAIGASGMSEAPNNNSTSYSTNIFLESFLPADTKIKIKDSIGTTIYRHTSAKKFDNIVISLPDFQLGETYRLYIDDEETEKFTLSDIVTIVGNQKNAFNNKPAGNPPAGEMPEMQNEEFPGTPMGPQEGDTPPTPPNF